MSKLEDLIQKLYPNGVEWKELGEVSTILIGEFVHKSKQSNNGEYPVYNGGITNTGFYEEFNREKNKIIISARGANAGFVNRVFTNFWSGNSCYTIEINENLLNWSYLYYFLKKYENKLMEIKQTGSIPAVSKKQVENIKIPIPPLEIQEEIVHILDSFTELTNELTNELTARRKQYEFYRDSLLTFGDEVEWKKLGEICELKTGGTPKTTINKYWDNGTIPWMSSGEVNKGKIYNTEKMITQDGLNKSNTKILPIDSVVIALAGQGTTRGKVALTKIELCTNQSLCGLIPNSNLNSDFLYFYLQTQYLKLREVSSGDGTRGGLNLKIIYNYTIPLPPLSEQERIVSILDKFDSLCNDITKGLPAEIEARKKQYEYYRDKLLTFKDISENK